MVIWAEIAHLLGALTPVTLLAHWWGPLLGLWSSWLGPRADACPPTHTLYTHLTPRKFFPLLYNPPNIHTHSQIPARAPNHCHSDSTPFPICLYLAKYKLKQYFKLWRYLSLTDQYHCLIWHMFGPLTSHRMYLSLRPGLNPSKVYNPINNQAFFSVWIRWEA